MYVYLIGDLLLAAVWLILLLYRKDLRKPMLWSGFFYAIFITGAFFVWWFPSRVVYLGDPLVPSYWDPRTLFNLSGITGGYAIEDLLFMFFVGGIATALYEVIYGKRIKMRKTYKPHFLALIVAYIGALAFLIAIRFVRINVIYALIFSGFVAALSIWVQRRDLIKHSLVGGLAFLAVYFVLFSAVNLMFPDFVHNTYNLKNLSGVLIIQIPLEELLYAISFGLMWAPLYEYIQGEEDVSSS